MMIKIIVLAILCEAIWENLKMIWENGKFNINRLGALMLGVILALATQLDLFKILDIEIIPVIGSIFTGILISRGANFIHDLLTKIQELSKGE